MKYIVVICCPIFWVVKMIGSCFCRFIYCLLNRVSSRYALNKKGRFWFLFIFPLLVPLNLFKFVERNFSVFSISGYGWAFPQLYRKPPFFDQFSTLCNVYLFIFTLFCVYFLFGNCYFWKIFTNVRKKGGGIQPVSKWIWNLWWV